MLYSNLHVQEQEFITVVPFPATRCHYNINDVIHHGDHVSILCNISRAGRSSVHYLLFSLASKMFGFGKKKNKSSSGGGK